MKKFKKTVKKIYFLKEYIRNTIMFSVLKWNKDYDILNISLKLANIIVKDTLSEIIHMSQNYLSAVRCLTRQAV